MQQAIPAIAIAAVAIFAGAIAMYILHAKRKKSKFKGDAKNGAGKGTSPERMVINRYIENFAMVPSFRAYSKKEAIEKLVNMAGEAFPELVCNVEHAKKAVFEREESMPTGLDDGIAVPHGRTDGVKQIAGVLAIVDNSENENGIIPDYETIDHSKIKVLCLTLIPNSINTPYLQLLAAFIRVLQDPDSRAQLLSCRTPQDMRDFFRSI